MRAKKNESRGHVVYINMLAGDCDKATLFNDAREEHRDVNGEYAAARSRHTITTCVAESRYTRWSGDEMAIVIRLPSARTTSTGCVVSASITITAKTTNVTRTARETVRIQGPVTIHKLIHAFIDGTKPSYVQNDGPRIDDRAHVISVRNTMLDSEYNVCINVNALIMMAAATLQMRGYILDQ